MVVIDLRHSQASIACCNIYSSEGRRGLTANAQCVEFRWTSAKSWISAGTATVWCVRLVCSYVAGLIKSNYYIEAQRRRTTIPATSLTFSLWHGDAIVCVSGFYRGIVART